MRFCRSAFILLKCGGRVRIDCCGAHLKRRVSAVKRRLQIALRNKRLLRAWLIVMPEKRIYFADLRGNGFNGVMSRMRSEARASDRQ